MERYRGKYRSDSIRIPNWDYGSPGFYYVTICTEDRECYFGDVILYNDPAPWREFAGMVPWDGMCGCIAGTHNYASLPPAARPAHAPEPHAVVQLTRMGTIAYQNWLDIPKHFPFVLLDEFIIMPDHLHGILCFQKPGYRKREANSFGPQSQNLGSVIRSYKAATKAYATTHNLQFGWQARFHDDVITSGQELDRIRKYILDNPATWLQKKMTRKI
jgi:putative transposase